MQGGQAGAVRDEGGRVDRRQKRGVADEGRHRGFQGRGHPFDQGVALRVDRGIIQGIGRSGNAQKTGRLFESLFAQALDFAQVLAGMEGPLLVPSPDDGRSRGLVQAGHVLQELLGSQVEVDPDPVDAALHDLVQGGFEPALVDVVLVLAHADRLGLDLDQLGQGILQAAGDGDRPADGDVELGEFLLGRGGGAVNAGPGLADDDA